MRKVPHGATHYSPTHSAYYKFPGGHVMTSAGWVPTTRSLDDERMAYVSLAVADTKAKTRRAAEKTFTVPFTFTGISPANALKSILAFNANTFTGIFPANVHRRHDKQTKAFKEVVTRAAGFAPDHVTPDPRAPAPGELRRAQATDTEGTSWAVNGEACATCEEAHDVFDVLHARRVSASITRTDEQGVEHRIQWVEWPCSSDPFEPTPDEMRYAGVPRVDKITYMLRRYLPGADIAADSIEIGGVLYAWDYYPEALAVRLTADGETVLSSTVVGTILRIIQFDIEADPRYRA
jgi:hypothetical protein